MAGPTRSSAPTDNADAIERLIHDPTGMRVLLVHAHPDDDTLSTGPLAAWVASSGGSVELVTCTRGERGEVVAGVLPEGVTPAELTAVREAELTAACAELGITDRWFLGSAPWREAGLDDCRYEDSGMRWVTPTLAGPAHDAGGGSLTMAPLAQEIADLRAGMAGRGYDVLVSYDDDGGYGHPDHVRCHQIAALACEQTGTPFVQVLSQGDDPGAVAAGWLDVVDPALESRVVAALRRFRTQLTVVGSGAERRIRHVGGQRQEIPRRIGLL
ncbi:PIG-L family deacetylase [uncultured Propionibacterium sp.]|uniref:PIG-L family deacetylase n=1 Tax=uncultured Propionibacterium sp. TaxID=218066 RepID=UPI0029316C0A|nr:PIG-L family deacetylase [uncultured Propionibacterium sp.]